MRMFGGALIAILISGASQAETPAFDPRSWKGQHLDSPTEVLTIGSTHLGQLNVTVTPDMLDPLLDRLIAYNPEIITHEGISGEQCDTLKRYGARYPGMFDNYCYDNEAAEKATGLTVPAAMAEVEKTLAEWPARATGAQRRRLTSLFLAAGDRPSARVQWLQLSAAERTTGDGINDALLKIVTRTGEKPNETFDIAVIVAARVGLNRVYAVDDHTADSIQGSAGPDLDKFLQGFWGTSKSSIGDQYGKLAGSLKSGDDVLALYRFTNAPATQREFISIDYKAAMNKPSAERFGRIYNAWNETRNLRMVSNIRAAFGNRPGARVLNIVGASHKPYYDAYLSMMSDVKLVDAEKILE